MNIKLKRKHALYCGHRKKLPMEEFLRMSKEYDELYNEADHILKKFNPCHIENGRCLSGLPCCEDCEFLSRKNGCKEKSLACKLWLCEEATAMFPECASLLDRLKKVARNIPHIPLGERSIKEDILFRFDVVG